jgi:hypothetical protein
VSESREISGGIVVGAVRKTGGRQIEFAGAVQRLTDEPARLGFRTGQPACTVRGGGRAAALR